MSGFVFRERTKAYIELIRIHQPSGIFLLLWPTMWALWIASEGRPSPTVFWVFIAGIFLMRSAGCAINDYADREFDGHVSRTSKRPLVTGAIAPWEALLVAAVLSIIAFGLVLLLNKITVLLSLCAFFLACTYPYTKRFISIPQLYLGVAFSFGIPMAFTAQVSHIPIDALLLAFGNIFWVLAYDTEYAMVDRDFDKLLPVKTSAIFFGNREVTVVMIANALFLLIMVSVGYRNEFGVIYFVSIAMAATLIGRQFVLVKDRLPENCFRAFQENNWVGMIIFLGLVAEYAGVAN